MGESIYKGKSLSIGQKVGRVREFKGFKQEYVASRLGIAQQVYSKIEQQDNIEDELFFQIAEILGVPVEAIKEFSDERVTYYINGPFLAEVKIEISNNAAGDNATGNFVAQQFNFHGDAQSQAIIKELVDRLVQSNHELSNFKDAKN